MHSRRKFLSQGGLAVSAILAAKPSAAITWVNSRLPALCNSCKRLVIAHTGTSVTSSHFTSSELATRIAAIKKEQKQLLLLNTGAVKSSNSGNSLLPRQWDYDASLLQADAKPGEHFTVVQKGSIKVGIIYAPEATGDAWIKEADSLAGMLKMEQQCKLVVCLWQPVWQSRPANAETAIAKNTQYLDMMIGATPSQELLHSVIALNQTGREVIFQYSQHNNEGAFSSMEIGFDDCGKRNYIALDRQG